MPMPTCCPRWWRQSIEAGDTVILASAALVDGLGADALKNAAVTLHPRSAAAHIHNRAVADGVTGSDAAIFIEVAQSTGAASRIAPEPPPILRPEDIAMAENIRARLDDLVGVPQVVRILCVQRRRWRPQRRRAFPSASSSCRGMALRCRGIPIQRAPARGGSGAQ